MVKILAAVLTDGLAAVEAACGEAASTLNILARRRDPGPAATIPTPADCARDMRRLLIAAAATACAGPADGTHREPRPDNPAQALRHARRLR
jgi:hypothetical protein